LKSSPTNEIIDLDSKWMPFSEQKLSNKGTSVLDLDM